MRGATVAQIPETPRLTRARNAVASGLVERLLMKLKTIFAAFAAFTAALMVFGAERAKFEGFERGMGIGGWLTNYKRFNVLPDEWRMKITVGDMEHFRSYITEADIKNIAEMGLDHVRLGFDQIVVEESPYKYRGEIFDIMEKFAGWCEKYRLNVVLNLHKAIGNYADIKEKTELLGDPGLQKRFVALWAEFERRFSGRKAVAFELLNEVRNVDPEKWNALADAAISEIRRLNPERKIILGGVNWNGAGALRKLRLYDDPNIIYTFHFYSPFEFTHQRGVLQAAPLFYNRVMRYPSDIAPYLEFRKLVGQGTGDYKNFKAMDREALRAMLKPAFDFAREHPDKILWCGEFGTIRHAPAESRENYMRDVISLLRENGIQYCVWNYLSTPNDGNRFSLVDDDSRKILSRRMLEIIRGEAE